jgi:hypothetical protein
LLHLYDSFLHIHYIFVLLCMTMTFFLTPA